MNTKKITINGRDIGAAFPPYVIAELSANHNGSIETAFTIIEQAKRSGADAIKIQTYTPDTLTLQSDRPDFQITEGLWKGKTLYELYDWAHTPWEWHKPLFDKAREIGLTIFSSPFDETAVDLLEDLGAPAYKVASFEIVDLALIKYVAATGKPMIMSTGMANLDEIEEAVTAAREGGCKQLALLHCVSAYPAAPSSYNLLTLKDMARRFGIPVGLSDHTTSNTTAISAVALGAEIIEKHVTLNKDGGGPDDSFSITPDELSALVKDANVAHAARGQVRYDRQKGEDENVKFRRSLYFIKNIPAGEVITKEHIRSIRPGFGLPPSALEKIIGRRLCIAVEKASPVQWKCFE